MSLDKRGNKRRRKYKTKPQSNWNLLFWFSFCRCQGMRSIEKVSLDKPPRHKLAVLKLNQRYRLYYRQLALSIQAWMSETAWTWQYRALCRFIDALSLQGEGITWDGKEATCLLIQSTMTSKDHIVLIIKLAGWGAALLLTYSFLSGWCDRWVLHQARII